MATTRDGVLSAAIALLLEEGPNSLTLERVARDAGVSKGGLLYHYAGKEQLLQGLIELVGVSLEGGRPLPGEEIGAILIAAMAIRPDLLDPLRERYRNRPATLAHLAAEGLWFRDALGLAPPTPERRAAITKEILSLEGETGMREESSYILPAVPVDAVAELAVASAEAWELAAEARETVSASAAALLKLQKPEGYWQGDLIADTTLESDYVLLTYWLDPGDLEQSRPKIQKAVRTILDRQLPDGGWNIYSGGPAEINATIRAYVALKIAGYREDLSRTRDRILALGGLQAANSYTKINFSLLGLFPRQFAPTVPPEIMLVPGNLLYEMSSWTRTIIVPLSIVQAAGGERPAPAGVTLDELYVPNKKLSLPRRDKVSSIFNQVDRFLKLWERRGLKEVRAKAIREAEKWMLDHMRHSDGIGAIYPSMMYALMAMEALGYERDHPDVLETRRQFEAFIIEREDDLEFQPSVSPVWDTAIAAFALNEAGAVDSTAMTRAADWLLEKEVRRKGDWSVKRPALTPSGWAFEFANEYYPDIDDTAMVLLCLQGAKASDPQRQERAERRAVEWLFGMQSSDGGWAAFDVDNNWQVLSKVPFADHNAMLDPTCPDITGRVLEALCRRGFTFEHPAIARAVKYLAEHQKTDGSWYGRWGVNYVYGTFLALRGLRASGAPGMKPAMKAAADWIQSVQNADGGWGESCASYEVHSFVRAASTPSQTAWALLGLEAAGVGDCAAARCGVKWLVEHQNAQGGWDEELTTGTGFPNVFYLSYRLYAHYFPLLALSVWSNARR